MSEPSPAEIRAWADSLIDLARRLKGEGEGMEIDEDFKVAEIIAIKSFLSETRAAIDVVSKALANLWDGMDVHPYFEDEHTKWYISRRKGKTAWDEDQFFEWLATKDADELRKLVSVSSIKVLGMTPLERETLLDEAVTSKTISIESRPRR